jgi:antitoxin MazE
MRQCAVTDLTAAVVAVLLARDAGRERFRTIGPAPLDILRSESSMYIHERIYIMDLQVAKWGNSLALRIPSEVVRRLGLHEGATVDAQITLDGALSIRPAQWDRKAFALELTEARKAMPMSAPVMEEVRRDARY